MNVLHLILFAFAWIVGIYVLNCLIARSIKKINLRIALLYITTVAMIGVYGEVFVGSCYRFLFSNTLWSYTVFPVHHTYTSRYALFLWGVYGLHLYLLHGTMQARKTLSIHRLALLFCVEAVLIEALVNLTFKLSFGQFIFYYYPSDLWHLTSLQTLPFYLLGGYVIAYSIKMFSAHPRYFAAMSAALACTLVFLA